MSRERRRIGCWTFPQVIGGGPPPRFALRWTTFDDARVTRLANRSRERGERLAKVGGEWDSKPR